MLANRELAQGVNRAVVFSAMVAELPWQGLKDYILASSQFGKACLSGGYRLEPKYRKRFESLLLKEAEKSEYSVTFCNPLFAQWYPVHAALYKTLEDYFHADEYKAYREAQSLADDAYALPAEVFARVFVVEDLETWRILLCFSPLQFSDDQTREILSNAGGNESLLKRIRQLDDMLDTARKEAAQASAETERLRSQAESGGGELQELRRERKALTAERNDLQAKFESSQTENRKLRQTAAQKDEEVQQAVARAQAQLVQDKGRLDAVIAKLEKEMTDWRNRYEQQRVEARGLLENLTQTQNALAQEKARQLEWERKTQELHRFADLVLQRIDWVQAGKNLHLTPILQRQFNSVMKKLHYEADGALRIDTALPRFWDRLMGQEKAIIDQVSQSNTLEVAHGTADDFWESLKEPFEDVVIGLEARVMLLKIIREIFYQIVTIEDLETPLLGKALTARK